MSHPDLSALGHANIAHKNREPGKHKGPYVFPDIKAAQTRAPGAVVLESTPMGRELAEHEEAKRRMLEGIAAPVPETLL